MQQANDSRKVGEDRRRSFRVNDVLSIVTRRIDPDQPRLAAGILPGFAEDYVLPESGREAPAEEVNPKLWNMLLQIQDRLELILNKLNLEDQGVTRAEPREVSLSTTGAKFTTQECYCEGDLLELKILLPLNPPLWIAIYGEVVRNGEGKEGLFETAVQFLDMDDSISAVINRYGLKRQRALIRKEKGD